MEYRDNNYNERRYPVEQQPREETSVFEEVEREHERVSNFEQKEVEIAGKKYILQKMPVRPAMELRQQWIVNGVANDYKMIELAIENLVVQPKVKLEDFDEVWEADALGVEAVNFQFSRPDTKNSKKK